MKNSRESIYQALFDLVSTSGVFITKSRRTKIFTEVPPEEQPALFIEQTKENPVYSGRNIPYKWELTVMVCIYVYSADESTAPATLLNPILDRIERIFKTGGPVPQTLGGLVEEARLLGEGHSHSGTLGSQAFAFIPVRIIAV